MLIARANPPTLSGPPYFTSTRLMANDAALSKAWSISDRESRRFIGNRGRLYISPRGFQAATLTVSFWLRPRPGPGSGYEMRQPRQQDAQRKAARTAEGKEQESGRRNRP